MAKVIYINSTQPPQTHVVHANNRHENGGKNNWLRNRSNMLIFIGMAILICITVAITYLAFISVASIRVPNVTTAKPDTGVEAKTNFDSSFAGAQFISRHQWLAGPPHGASVLQVPVPYIIISHTATEGCNTLHDCRMQILRIQQLHMNSNGWADIGYNFLIGGDDGYIFEGRGWTTLGRHTENYNSISIGIAFVGVFEKKLPSNASLLAAQKLIQRGVEEHYIKEDYKLFGARQSLKFSNSEQKLYELIKSWPHWESKL